MVIDSLYSLLNSFTQLNFKESSSSLSLEYIHRMTFSFFFFFIFVASVFISGCDTRPVRTQGKPVRAVRQRRKVVFKPSSGSRLIFPSCTAAEIEADYATVKLAFANEIANNPSLLPAYVRAAFHDCFTASTDKPESGCNGSLRLLTELTNFANSNLAVPMLSITTVVAGTCVSVADGIQLANAVALEISGGPLIASDVVDSSNPRGDASSADTVVLPPRGGSFTQLLELYETKGFDATDLVSSSAGGHSLGRFTQGATRVPFTNDTQLVSGHYSYNLVQKRVSTTNLDGFNTLNSDNVLNDNADSRTKLDSYAGCQQNGGVCSPNFTTGIGTLNHDFKIFLIKMSRLTGTTVGNSAALSQGL